MLQALFEWAPPHQVEELGEDGKAKLFIRSA